MKSQKIQCVCSRLCTRIYVTFQRTALQCRRRQPPRPSSSLLQVLLFYSLLLLLFWFSFVFWIKHEQLTTKIFPFNFLPMLSRVKIRNGYNTIHHEHRHHPKSTPKCALLFFGLIKESFASISLPSIQKNILSHNPTCDIYLHTYNVTHLPLNERNGEHQTLELNISQVYLLTHNVTLENMEEFYKTRKDILNQTRKFHHKKWGTCCTSHDNMIKQWNSIQGVWDLMMNMSSESSPLTRRRYKGRRRSDHERLHHVGGHQSHYEQVGLFRSDVFYTRPIDIFDSKAAVPNFAHHYGYNDRLFYGTYENARIWASKRFSFLDTFEKRYMKHDSIDNVHSFDAWGKIRKLFGKRFHQGYHSESFVKSLMDHHGIRVDFKEHCVWRVRTGYKVVASDCDGMEGFSTFEDVRMYQTRNMSSSLGGGGAGGRGGDSSMILVV